MKSNDKIIKLVTAALMAALTCVATISFQIKVPNTSNGYIHPGDAFVLLSGIILGPLYGGLAAGIGSFFADIYFSAFAYAPATLIIKALAAAAGFYSYRYIVKRSVIIASLFTSIVVDVCYFLYEIVLYGKFYSALLLIPMNLLQNAMCIVLSVILLPLLLKVPQIRAMIDKK
jgi:uncharacterized membrane protein